MEERPILPSAQDYDIFLCTRELPDALTAETAALRQLCSALIGEGWRVFFPSALPKELTDEQRAEAIVEALRRSKVMVAAMVGSEGAADGVARKLRETFRSEAAGDPARGFIACARDVPAEALPEDLADTELLDMSDLSFLVTLREQLAARLTPPPEEEPVEEPAPEPAAEKKPFPWKWVLLGVVIVALIAFLFLRK